MKYFMSHKNQDGLSRSSRTRHKRIAKGLCPDCGLSPQIEIKGITRCFKCRFERNLKRKRLNDTRTSSTGNK